MSTTNERPEERILDLSQVLNLSVRGAGLVIGPGLSTYPTVVDEALRHIRTRFPYTVGSVHHYYDFAEKLLAENQSEDANLREELQSFFRKQATNPQLRRLVRPRWKAVFSLSEDDFFKQELALYLNGLPTTLSVTGISHPDVQPEIRSIPIFELLGDINDVRAVSRIAVTRAEFLARRRTWRDMLARAPDFMKGAVLVFAGTSSVTDLVAEFLNEALALKPLIATQLVFLHDDPTALDPRVLSLIAGRCSVFRVKATLPEVCEAVSATREPYAAAQTVLPLSDIPYDPEELTSVADQLACVPIAAQLSQTSKAERVRLLDILFSPSHLDWSPFAADLDFRREVASIVKARIEHAFQNALPPSAKFIGIKGESGIGKTTTLKRVAYDLAQEKYLCLWIRKSYGEISGGRFDTVLKRVEKSIGTKRIKVIFFYDDPLSGNIALQDMFSTLALSRIDWVAVLCVRNSDLTNSRLADTEPFAASNAVEFTELLTEREMQALPEYLAKIGAATSVEAAQVLVNGLRSRSGQDILCALWYALPSTRASLSTSISDEYVRLGGAEGVVTTFAEAVADTMAVARRAYELVATATGLGAAVPMEVLVRSLGVEYGLWIEMCSANRPLWGLLYDVPYVTAETHGYRTRNEVVTRVLLRLLNGGLVTHVGEFRCLRDMIRACVISSPPYHEFLIDILVRKREALSDIMSYEQGLELYDLALNSYPRRDRTLAHHRGLWIKNVGRDTSRAYEALEYARAIPVTGASQEPEAFVFTSMAATVVQAVKENRLEPQDGLSKVEELLGSANRLETLNLHSQHVHASLLVELATRLRLTDREAFFVSLQRAARIVDYTLLLINPETTRSLDAGDGVQMLLALRSQIFTSHLDLMDAQSAADELFQRSHNQLGFALVGRRMLLTAVEANKGAAFKKVLTYIENVVEQIGRDGQEPCIELVILRAELFIKWRVLRVAGRVEWVDLRSDLDKVVQNHRFSRDPLWLFYSAVAHYHLNEYTQAEALFGQLRAMHLPRISRSSHRCVFLDLNGNPEYLQGELQPGPDRRRYILFPRLSTVVMVKGSEFSQPDGTTVHAYIVFTMEGPLAVSSLAGAMRERGPVDKVARPVRPL